MESWRSVRLTRARQIGELMELRAGEMPGADVPVRPHYEALRATDPSQAAAYIDHALPRRKAIQWAAGLIDAAHGDVASPERTVSGRARLWLSDPDDRKRRDANSAKGAGRDAPERTLATAIFYNGGSIAPEDVAPVQPAAGLANRVTVAAVEQAAYRSTDPRAFFAQALDGPETIAEQAIAPRP